MQPGASLPPLLLRPHYVPKPWGGQRLATELARTDVPPVPIGESWEAFDLDLADGTSIGSTVDGGPHHGRRLRDVLGAPPPLLLKVLDAREDLSVQVHPAGRAGKEEAWAALADGGRVACARPGQTFAEPAADILADLEHTDLRAGCPAGSHPPTLAHVPPGSVHAILAGALVFEIQNPVHVTYRLHDHGRLDADGRARDLHLDEAAPLLARASPTPATPVEAGCRLEGERFTVATLPPGTTKAPVAQALFFRAAGNICYGEGEQMAVPAGRTVWLPSPVGSVTSQDWIVSVRAR